VPDDSLTWLRVRGRDNRVAIGFPTLTRAAGPQDGRDCKFEKSEHRITTSCNGLLFRGLTRLSRPTPRQRSTGAKSSVPLKPSSRKTQKSRSRRPPTASRRPYPLRVLSFHLPGPAIHSQRHPLSPSLHPLCTRSTRFTCLESTPCRNGWTLYDTAPINKLLKTPIAPTGTRTGTGVLSRAPTLPLCLPQ
jgi:hypothetical protein